MDRTGHSEENYCKVLILAKREQCIYRGDERNLKENGRVESSPKIDCQKRS